MVNFDIFRALDKAIATFGQDIDTRIEVHKTHTGTAIRITTMFSGELVGCQFVLSNEDLQKDDYIKVFNAKFDNALMEIVKDYIEKNAAKNRTFTSTTEPG